MDRMGELHGWVKFTPEAVERQARYTAVEEYWSRVLAPRRREDPPRSSATSASSVPAVVGENRRPAAAAAEASKRRRLESTVVETSP